MTDAFLDAIGIARCYALAGIYNTRLWTDSISNLRKIIEEDTKATHLIFSQSGIIGSGEDADITVENECLNPKHYQWEIIEPPPNFKIKISELNDQGNTVENNKDEEKILTKT